jgi:hypothetical protein
METPSGEKMIAIPFTISFVTWMSESEAKKYSARWQEVTEQVASGTCEMLREKFVGLNENWKHIYLEVGSANLKEGANA